MKDLMIREIYIKDGVEKKSWNKIGVLIDGQAGKQYIKLFHIPGVLINVFEQKTESSEKVIDPKDINWNE